MSEKMAVISRSVKQKIDAYNGILNMIDVYNRNKIEYDDFLDEIMPLADKICGDKDDAKRLVLNIGNYARCRDNPDEYHINMSQKHGEKIYRLIFSEIINSQKNLIKSSVN